MKDLFSSHSENYAKFRPTYPPELFTFLKNLCPTRERAWDCATGNGQVAGELAQIFQQVCATDISLPQLSQAVQKPNIQYTLQKAETTNFPANHFDLLTVGQAIHWFEFDSFYTEAKRVLKKDAVIAIFGYALLNCDPETNKVIAYLYRDILNPYWQPERRYLDDHYKSLPFPFEVISAPSFKLKVQWSFERLMGYLNTWSAVKSYEKEKGENPVDLIKTDLQEAFGEVGSVEFPILLKVGRNAKVPDFKI